MRAESKFLRIIAWLVVSVRPPLLEIIVAQPLEVASSAILPKGSSHFEGTTDIEVLSSKSKTLLWLKNPNS